MKEKTILRVALTCAFVGIFILYLVSESITLDEAVISRIESEGEMVKLTGTIEDTYYGNKTTMLKLSKSESIDIVLIDRLDVNLSTGDLIEVIGEVGDYNGKKELIAHRLRVIR